MGYQENLLLKKGVLNYDYSHLHANYDVKCNLIFIRRCIFYLNVKQAPATYPDYTIRLFALFGPTVDGIKKQKSKKKKQIKLKGQ